MRAISRFPCVYENRHNSTGRLSQLAVGLLGLLPECVCAGFLVPSNFTGKIHTNRSQGHTDKQTADMESDTCALAL